MLLALWPALIPQFRQPIAVVPVQLQIPRKPFPAREVIPRRLFGKIDKLRDDDALFVVLLM